MKGTTRLHATVWVMGLHRVGFFFSASNLGAVVDPEQNFWIILLL